jgi:hypothetical protein
MAARRTLEGLIFGDGVVVGFAFAVTEPGEGGEGYKDDADAYTEFCASFQMSPLPKRI